MKKSLLAVVLAVASLGAMAQTGLSKPGSTWAQITSRPSVLRNTPEDKNWLLQGNIEQGVIVARFGKSSPWKVNTYASLAFSADKNGLAYNNKLVPAIGVKLQRPFENGNIDIGVQLVHQNNFRGVTLGEKSGTGVQFYAQYWFGWDLQPVSLK
jgi:hypothetical protein